MYIRCIFSASVSCSTISIILTLSYIHIFPTSFVIISFIALTTGCIIYYIAILITFSIPYISIFSIAYPIILTTYIILFIPFTTFRISFSKSSYFSTSTTVYIIFTLSLNLNIFPILPHSTTCEFNNIGVNVIVFPHRKHHIISVTFVSNSYSTYVR